MLLSPVLTVPGSVLVFDGSAVVEANDAACRELRRDRYELLGKGFLSELVPEHRALVVARVEEGEADDGSEPLVVWRRTMTTAVDVLELRFVRQEGGEVLVDIRDVTEKHRLDAVLGVLARMTMTLDESNNITWRPFGNYVRNPIAEEEYAGVNALEWVHPDDVHDLMAEAVDVMAEPGGSRVGYFRTRKPFEDNQWVYSRLTGVNAFHDPLIGGMLLRIEEQTEPDRVESLGRTTGRFKSLAEGAPIGILLFDRLGECVYTSHKARALVGIGDQRPGEVDWMSFVRPDRRDDVVGVLAAAFAEQTTGSTTAPIEHADGRTVWLRMDTLPQVDEDGRLFGLITTLQDMTAEVEARQELAEANESVRRLANFDSLTGLPNRMHGMERLGRALARQSRDGSSLALMFCDLDGFKAANDEQGHLVGDALLVEAARRMQSVIRTSDVVLRFGGDEFLVIFEGFAEQTEVEAAADRIIQAIDQPILVAGQTLHIGVTIGIAISEPGLLTDELVRRSDQAMYRGKAEARGCWHY